MDLDQILPHLFLGTCPTCPKDIGRLKGTYRITGVLNLQTQEDLASRGIDWNRLEAYYCQSGIEVQHVPMEDSASDHLRECLPGGVQALEQLLRKGHWVYVHCSQGVNRAPSVVVAYLHWVRGWGLRRAMSQVIRSRSCNPQMKAIRSATEDRMRELCEEMDRSG